MKIIFTDKLTGNGWIEYTEAKEIFLPRIGEHVFLWFPDGPAGSLPSHKYDVLDVIYSYPPDGEYYVEVVVFSPEERTRLWKKYKDCGK